MLRRRPMAVDAVVGGVNVDEDLLRQLVVRFDEPDFLIDALQKSGAGIGGELPAVEINGDGFDFVVRIVETRAAVWGAVVFGVVVFGTAVAKSGVVMIHCVWPLVEKMRCNPIATRAVTTFDHNGHC